VNEASGLWAGQHIELIEGELINKMGKNDPHIEALTRIVQWLVGVFGWDLVRFEAPIDVAPEDNPTSEPEPDAIVFKAAAAKPRRQAANLALVVEVADTTLNFDLTVKAGLYARAGIADYWVLDLNGRRMIVHRVPEAGVYESVVAYAENESVAPLSAPDHSLLVGDALV
jgi:Uma2 family endonuclease